MTHTLYCSVWVMAHTSRCSVWIMAHTSCCSVWVIAHTLCCSAWVIENVSRCSVWLQCARSSPWMPVNHCTQTMLQCVSHGTHIVLRCVVGWWHIYRVAACYIWSVETFKSWHTSESWHTYESWTDYIYGSCVSHECHKIKHEWRVSFWKLTTNHRLFCSKTICKDTTSYGLCHPIAMWHSALVNEPYRSAFRSCEWMCIV